MSIVVDTSISMAWVFAEESAPLPEQILDHVQAYGTVVPPIWPMEVLNTLVVAERRGRITAQQSVDFLTGLVNLNIEVDGLDWRTSNDRILALAREHQLTSYDASYLELSMRRSLPLATLDAKLRAAAIRAGVPLA